MSRVTTIEMQFGTAILDSSGTGPILVNVTGSDESSIAVMLTPNENVNLSSYVLENPLYAIASTEQKAIDYNYFIVSST